MSLPRMARRSLRLPSSWATEINLQSRYPGGIMTPKIGAASSSACPGSRAIKATLLSTPITTSHDTIRLTWRLLQITQVSRLQLQTPTRQEHGRETILLPESGLDGLLIGALIS